MVLKKPKIKTSFFQKNVFLTVITIAIACVFLYLLYLISGILALLFFSLLFSVAATPFITFFNERLKFPIWLSILIVYILIVVLLIIFLFSIAPIFINQFTNIVSLLSHEITNFQQQFAT